MAMHLGAVLLASGLGKRFREAARGGLPSPFDGNDHGGKLLTPLCGRPLVAFALDALLALHADKTVVVTGSERIAALASSRGMQIIPNDAPELGQAHTIALGVTAVRDMDAALLLAADMPRLSAASLRALIDAFQGSGKGIACLRDETHWGNPAVFAARYFDVLCALTGDRGAKGILRTHACDLQLVDCKNPFELEDVDTPEDLQQLRTYP